MTELIAEFTSPELIFRRRHDRRTARLERIMRLESVKNVREPRLYRYQRFY